MSRSNKQVLFQFALMVAAGVAVQVITNKLKKKQVID